MTSASKGHRSPKQIISLHVIFYIFVYLHMTGQIKTSTLPKGTQDAIIPSQISHASAEGRDGHLHLGKICSQSQLATFPQGSDQTGMTHKQLHTATSHWYEAARNGINLLSGDQHWGQSLCNAEITSTNYK